LGWHPDALLELRELWLKRSAMDLSTTLVFSVLGLGVFASLMVWAGIGDIRTFMITNKLNATIALAFLTLCLPMGLGWPAIVGHLKIGAIAFGVAFVLYMLRVYGGGDFKMTGAVALWLGPAAILPFVVYTSLAGGALAISLITMRALARRYGLPKSPRWARRLLRKRSGAPYGVALGAGALLATPFALWFPHNAFG
jgi:prepilin peptidase CpaA